MTYTQRQDHPMNRTNLKRKGGGEWRRPNFTFLRNTFRVSLMSVTAGSLGLCHKPASTEYSQFLKAVHTRTEADDDGATAVSAGWEGHQNVSRVHYSHASLTPLTDIAKATEIKTCPDFGLAPERRPVSPRRVGLGIEGPLRPVRRLSR